MNSYGRLSETYPRAGNEKAVLFDLDGVLADTVSLHQRSWQVLAEELHLPFDNQLGDAMRGLSREESLALFIRGHEQRFDPVQREQLLVRKQKGFLEQLACMTPADLFPGIRALLDELRARGVRTAVASSSRNAVAVIQRLGLHECFDAVVDGNQAPRSKPDPLVYQMAAQAVATPPSRCVAIEDAAAGIEAAHAAEMRVIGVGPASRVGSADLIVAGTDELSADRVLGVLPS